MTVTRDNGRIVLICDRKTSTRCTVMGETGEGDFRRALDIAKRKGWRIFSQRPHGNGAVTTDLDVSVYFRATTAATFVTLNTGITVGTNYAELEDVSIERVASPIIGTPTAAARPILRGSGPYRWLEFDGVDDVLASSLFPFTNPFSRFAAIRQLSWQDSDRLIGGGNVSEGELQQRGGGSPGLSMVVNGASPVAQNMNAPIGADAVTLEEYLATGSRHALTVNRGKVIGAVSATGAAGPGGVKLGANRFGSGQGHLRLYAALAVRRVVTPAEANGGRALMAAKMGLAL